MLDFNPFRCLQKDGMVACDISGADSMNSISFRVNAFPAVDVFLHRSFTDYIGCLSAVPLGASLVVVGYHNLYVIIWKILHFPEYLEKTLTPTEKFGEITALTWPSWIASSVLPAALGQTCGSYNKFTRLWLLLGRYCGCASYREV